MSKSVAPALVARNSTAAPISMALLAIALLVPVAFPSLARGACGDGVVDGSEECDPNCGNPGPMGCQLYVNGDPDLGTCTTGTDCFYEFSCCKFNCQFVGSGAPCEDGNECTGNEICDQVGNCLGGTNLPFGAACGDPTATDCDAADTCDGAGSCSENIAAQGSPAPTQCADGMECTADQCDGAGGCQNPNAAFGTPCGDPTSIECDEADTCNGAGACLPNLVAQGSAAPTQCADGMECTADQCDGAGGCQNPNAAAGSPCGDPTGTECDLPDSCDGAGSCSTRLVAAGSPAPALCDDSQNCTFDECDGAGGCQNPGKPDGAACDDGNECTIAGTCGASLCDPVGPAFVFSGRARFFRNGRINADLMVDNEERGIVEFFRGTTAAPGTTLTSRVVRLLRNATAEDVNATLLLGPGNVLGTLTSPFVSPGAADLCVLPAMTCGGPDVFVPAGTTQALPPGAYDRISIGGGATLELEEGLYQICTLRGLGGATVRIVPGAGDPVLEVADFFRVRHGFTMTSDPGAATPQVFVGRKVSIGAASMLSLHLVAPDSVIKLGRATVIDGTICAERLTAYREVELGCTL